jgi:hypothetical protein
VSNYYSYKIGDLVKCIYDLFDYYEDFWDQLPQEGYPFYGIVIAVQDEFLHEEKHGYDKLYVVQCFDGHVRFFAYWEMRIVSTSS